MKKKPLVALVGFILIVFAIIVMSGGQTRYYTSLPLAQNIQQPYVNENEIYFYTGHGFAKYEIEHKRTTTLTPFTRFPEFSEINISNTGAVFKTENTYLTDDLHAFLVSRHLSPDQGWWWHVGFDTGELKLVGESEGIADKITSAQIGAGGITATTNSFSDKPARLFAEKSGELSEVYSIDEGSFTKILWASPEKIIFSARETALAPIQLNVLNISEKAVVFLPETISGDVKVNYFGDVLVFQSLGSDEELNEALGQGLYSYKLGEKDPQRVLSGFVGTVTPDGFGRFIATGVLDEQGYVGVIESDRNINEVSINNNEHPLEYSFATSTSEKAEEIVVVDNQNQLYLFSSEEEMFNMFEPVISEAQKVVSPDFTITYLEPSNSFSVLVTQTPFNKNVGLAVKKLQELGVDTNQHEINANPVRSLGIE